MQKSFSSLVVYRSYKKTIKQNYSLANNTFSRKKSTKWNLFFLYLRVLIGIVNGILIVPLYLKYINNDLYGAWLATGNILIWITIIDPGVGEVLTQKVSVLFSRKDYNSMKYIFSSAILISFIITVLALIGSFTISYYLPELLMIKNTVNRNELIGAFQIMSIGTACTLFSYSFAGILNGFQQVKFQGIIQVISGLLGILLNIILLYTNYGLYSIAIQFLFRGAFVLFCYSIYFIYFINKQKIGMSFDKSYFFEFSKVFSYTWVGKIFGVLSENIDLIIISRYIGPQFVIMLEMTRRPINTLSSLINMPSVAILPAASHLYGEGDTEKLKTIVFRFLRISLYILFLVSFGFIAFNHALVSLWVGERYYLGGFENILICLTFLITAVNFNLMIFSFSFGNIKGNSLFVIFKSLFYISLLYFASKFFGIVGILILTLITATLGCFYLPKVLIKIIKASKNEIKQITYTIFLLLILGIALAIPFSYISISTWFELIFCAFCLGFIYIYILWFFNRDFKSELNKIKIKLVK